MVARLAVYKDKAREDSSTKTFSVLQGEALNDAVAVTHDQSNTGDVMYNTNV